jgi:hypothetical protein
MRGKKTDCFKGYLLADVVLYEPYDGGGTILSCLTPEGRKTPKLPINLHKSAPLYILKEMTNRFHFGFIIRYWHTVAAQVECSR